jgi:phosphatidate cytidylyltransferase
MDGANAASADSPSKASSLLLRVVSGLVLIPIIVAAAWWPAATAILVAFCAALGVRELAGILRAGGYAPRTNLGIGIGIALCIAAAFQPYTAFDLTGAALAMVVIVSLSAEIARTDRSTSLISWALTLTGALYIGWLLSHFILIGQINTPLRNGWLGAFNIPPGTAWICFTLAITWLQDTAAYFVGRRFGKHRFAPVLSPKKTWEGAIGGFLASVLTAIIAVLILGLPVNMVAAALIGAVAGVAGPLGDLAESLIKRQIGVKDSGQLIPGHGGILDRIDSLLFTGPLIYYMVLLTLAFA